MATRASHRRAEAAEEPEFRHGDVFYVYTRRGFVRDHCLNSAILATPNGLLGGKRGRSFSRRRVHHDAYDAAFRIPGVEDRPASADVHRLCRYRNGAVLHDYASHAG